MPQDAATRVQDFLLLNGGQSYCDECLARALKLRTASQARRAAVGLAKTDGYRRDETECSHCSRTTLTTTALWVGH
jgi:hypothetical protein